MIKEMQRVLIVDDEPDILELLSITLGRMGLETERADDVKSAIVKLKHHAFQLCITDMKMPDASGMDLLHFIQQNCPTMPVAILTAHGDIDSAIEALKLGAFDFVNKPIDLDRLRQLVNTALKTYKPVAESSTHRLIGNSDRINHLRAMIDKVARNQAPVYINGESGTGKELVAQLIHELSPRAPEPFIPINCGAIPSELMESEFFGHKRGSFTGATSDKVGLFEAAHGGTLFLDEIGDLPLPMQVKLLRAIQEQRIRPVGSHQEIDVDVRFLSASHKDLAALVEQDAFRADLFYRLNVITINVPSLRERIEDLEQLTDHIFNKLGYARYRLSTDALQALCGYAFPGNIRELENILERAITLSDSETISTNDLQLTSKQPQHSSTPTNDVKAVGFIDLEKHLEDIERKLILEALEATRWNRTSAARRLGLSFRSLRYRLKKLNIE